MESMKREKLVFDGTGNVKEFLTKANLMSTLKGYEIGQMDREQAVVEFSNRSRLINERAKTFVYKLQLLASLACPDFDNTAKGVIVKDAYVRGLHHNLQLQLKSLEKIAIADVKTLVQETNRLEVAGVRPTLSTRTTDYINTVDNGQATENKLPSTKYSSKRLVILL